MADLSNPLTQVVVGQAQPAVTVNNLFDACSPAHLYGQNDLTTIGLTWGYYGGRFRGIAVAHGTIALPANQANVYIVASVATAVVSQSTSTTNWNDSTNYMRLFLATTGPSTIIDWDDYREWLASAGAGVATVDTETLQDIIADLIQAGPNITKQYNDGDSPATLVISAAASGTPLTQENVEDIVASLVTAGTGLQKQYNDGDSPATLVLSATSSALTRELQFSASDMTTALTTGTNKFSCRAPRTMNVTGVRAAVDTPQASGSILTIDINEAGTTILSTKLTIDNTEGTSTTAATPAVISDATIADDAKISVDVDQIGDGTAKGLTITIYYT